MEETYGFDVKAHSFTKTIKGRNLVFTRMEEPHEIDPYMDLFQEIWGLDDRGRIPVHEPVSVARVGGLFLGITLDDLRVGFVYVLPAYLPGYGFHHHSNIMGFLEPYRNMGLALEAKRVHAVMARRAGIDIITWTFDPLQGANANLNFRKLGCICRRYVENAYGYIGGTFDSGLPTDRFLVEWHINSERVKQRLLGRIPEASALAEEYNDAPMVTAPDDLLKDPVLKVRVPEDVLEIAQEGRRFETGDPVQARILQAGFRKVIKHMISMGYTVSELLSLEKEGHRDNVYILQKEMKI